MIGSVLGARYRITNKLGEGAMGVVYLAEHIHLHRQEAVKVLRPDVSATPALVARFRREIRAINRVQHPNIVGVFDFGQTLDGRLYLAMEYANGQLVSDIVRAKGPLSVPLALHVLHQLASAVTHAHSHGVLHRDLRPSNLVLVTHRGHSDVLKVLDFGMAKIVFHSEAAGVTNREHLFGIPAYMAPEQFTGMGADPRSDIYAIGCLAHALLVGTPPFAGNRVQIISAHLEAEPPSLTQRNPHAQIPPELEAIVMQCLAKAPGARFQTGRQLCMALEQAPGFPGKQTMNRATRMGIATGWSGRPSDIIAGEATHATPSESLSADFETDIATADTASASASDVRDRIFEALLELAERMVDYGAQSPQVILAIAQVRTTHDDMMRLEHQRDALEEREARVEQTTRDREASLRFALAELRFDKERGRQTTQPDIDYQLEQLQARLHELLRDTHAQLEEITEEGITLAARIDQLEDQWASAFVSLRTAVRERMGSLNPNDSRMMPLIQRHETIEDALEQLS